MSKTTILYKHFEKNATSKDISPPTPFIRSYGLFSNLLENRAKPVNDFRSGGFGFVVEDEQKGYTPFVDTLNFYFSDDINDVAARTAMQYPVPYQRTVKNMILCSHRFKVSKCSNQSCNYSEVEYKTVFKCHVRYCNHKQDVIFRIARAKDRLNSLPIFSKRLYHFVIGSNQLTRRELSKVISKYMQRMRKLSYKLNYIKVFDMTNQGWNHFHIAVLPEKIKPRDFIAQSQAVLNKINPVAICSNIGYRNKAAIINYFAQRIAGQYGHKGNYYYLPDILDLDAYFKIYYRAKVVTYSLPKGLTCKNAPSSKPICPYCQSELAFSHYETDYKLEAVKPP